MNQLCIQNTVHPLNGKHGEGDVIMKSHIVHVSEYKHVFHLNITIYCAAFALYDMLYSPTQLPQWPQTRAQTLCHALYKMSHGMRLCTEKRFMTKRVGKGKSTCGPWPLKHHRTLWKQPRRMLLGLMSQTCDICLVATVQKLDKHKTNQSSQFSIWEK